MPTKKRLRILSFVIILTLCICIGGSIIKWFLGAISDNSSKRNNYNDPSNSFAEQKSSLEIEYQQYDSYVIGSSAAYDINLLNEYLDACFYNLSSNSCSVIDYYNCAAHIIENYKVDHIILNLNINEASNYGAEKLHGSLLDPNSHICPSNEYDKQSCDIEKIGDIEIYRSTHNDAFPVPQGTINLPYIRECVNVVADICTLCAKNGVDLIVIETPIYSSVWHSYEPAELRTYKEALAKVVSYWDFSFTSISNDCRYFYDVYHFRKAVGTMILAEVFGNSDIYRPSDFGTFVSAENCSSYLNKLFSSCSTSNDTSYTKNVPILMYHHFTNEIFADTCVSPANFEMQIRALAESGYTAVSFPEMIDYVYHGGSLPAKPVCITIDDGYYSNYQIAYPILKKYGMKATIFAIGSSVGHMEYYKDTTYPIIPHFSYDNAREMVDSGVIDFQSHSYDMHQWRDFEDNELVRSSMLPLDGESEFAYAKALKNDMALYEAIRIQELGKGFCALSYPGGFYNDLVETLVHEAGIPATVSIRTDSSNILIRGLPQSLYALCRMNVTDNTTVDELLNYVSGQ